MEELLAGAGMSGFLGILDPPVLTTQLEKLVGGGDSGDLDAAVNKVGWDAASPEMPARVASVVLKVEALTELLKATVENRRNGEAC